ncbi:MAG: phage tail tape measure protein, partial [Hyphomicrobiales bacterium]
MQRNTDRSFANLTRSVRTSMGGLHRAIAPVVGTLGVREVLNWGDEWISASNKIAAAGQVVGLQVRSLNELKDSANEARTAFSDYVDLYSRLIRSSATVGATELEVARATDLVAKSLKAGGASAQEQAASLIQLGQALGSGILQGDELRSIRENAPLVARAIAKEFGVTIGELKALGAEGKLTSDRVFRALLNGAEDIEAAFKTTRSTVKDAFTRIENEFIAYIGNADMAQGATGGLIEALNFLAENFEEVADVVVQFALVLAAAFAGKAIVGGIGAATVALGGLLIA